MLCMSCNPVQDIPEEGYLQHMKVVHGNAPQAQTIQPSIPGQPPVDPAFEQTWKEIQEFEKQKKLEQQSQPKPQVVQSDQYTAQAVPVVEKPIELTYVYTGTNNGHQVQTLELDVDGKHFVIAFDPVEKKQVESREVADLKADLKEDLRHIGDIIENEEEAELKPYYGSGLFMYECQKCKKQFKNTKALSMHKMRVHREVNKNE